MSKDLVKGRETKQIRIYREDWVALKHLQIDRNKPFADEIHDALEPVVRKHGRIRERGTK